MRARSSKSIDNRNIEETHVINRATLISRGLLRNVLSTPLLIVLLTLKVKRRIIFSRYTTRVFVSIERNAVILNTGILIILRLKQNVDG